MMILNAYAVLDNKVGVFSSPFFCHHDAIAKRSLYEASANAETMLARYPTDFTLFRVGQFDDANGVLLACTPENLGTVSAIVNAEFAAYRRSQAQEEIA